ncbi:MAG: glycoside hydrolase family 3 C-terminal domain-containing protein [Acidimicrobiales bacterium]|jgi:beta-glucosidase|nr:glycoside hydrolase family 3 C-terminal domain-containing protein [Acidimicrobiales bacterium]
MTDDRTREVLTGLDDVRKVALLSGRDDWHLEAVPELDLPAVMMTDGPHGLRKVEGDHLLDAGRSVPATCFPTAAGLGATWDRALLREVGAAIGREARAEDIGVVLGPGVNIKRHPLCGRNFEYFSEDPLLSGELAAAFIEGLQSTGVGASLKHYAVNNQESHRMVVDVVLDERTLREIYLPAFERAVTRAQPWTVMAAYNRVGGTYCSQHRHLLTTVLREEWGFEGLVVSDWGAVSDRVAGIDAGMDLEMPGGGSVYDHEVLVALERGELSRDALDASVERVVALSQRVVAGADAPSEVDLDANHALARRAAAASAVLLTNRDGALPLDPSGRVAVIGRFAAHPRYQGAGSSQVTPHRVDAALDELRTLARAAGGRVQYAAGYDAASGDRPDLIDEAVAIARAADAAVVFVGLPAAWESEGFDRTHLRLPRQHDELVRAVAAVNPRTVVVLANGAPIALPWVDDAAAVIEGYLGGSATGGGMADVLYGVAEPGGRLAETFPLRLADLAADRWFPGEPRQVQYREGLYVGYRWFDTAGADVAFPFGHGLSYTSFELGTPTPSTTAVDAGDAGAEVTLTVTVTNVGERRGSEVVQVYVRAVGSPVHRPERELRAFEKVHLAPGESTEVRCTLDRRAFAHWDVASGDWAVAPGRYEILVGRSSRAIDAVVAVDVGGEPVAGDDPAVAAAYREPSPDDWDVDDDAFEALLGHAVPTAEGDRPFHRDSTLGEVGATLLGRPLLELSRRVARRMVRGADADGGLGIMVERALVELPLRNAAAMSKGAVPLRAIDGTIRVLNRLSRSR